MIGMMTIHGKLTSPCIYLLRISFYRTEEVLLFEDNPKPKERVIDPQSMQRKSFLTTEFFILIGYHDVRQINIH